MHVCTIPAECETHGYLPLKFMEEQNRSELTAIAALSQSQVFHHDCN